MGLKETINQYEIAKLLGFPVAESNKEQGTTW